jgi:hypothetical protein
MIHNEAFSGGIYMDLIAVHPYYKIQREINCLEQKKVEQERHLYLYNSKVVTKYREFTISDVFDMSYRTIGNEGGFLYLHTSKGVYSYKVKTDPKDFITAFHSLSLDK